MKSIGQSLVLEKPVLHIYDIRKERELETVQKLAHVETASAAAERGTQAEEAHAVAAEKGRCEQAAYGSRSYKVLISNHAP